MSDDSSDEEFVPVFAGRADNIMKKQREAYEEMLKKVEEEDIAKTAKDEENELLVKIHEKLKRKPRANRKTNNKACPPKPVEKSLPTRRSNRRRKTTPEKDVSEDVVSKLEKESPINLPARAKKKLLKIDLENKREKKRIETLNKKVLSFKSSFNDEDMTIEIEDDRNITLKISYLSDISKITVCENEKFSSIFSKVLDLFKLKANEVTLCLRDEIISLDDTPANLKVKSWDVIDCIPYKSTEEMQNDANPNKILIKMQSSDSRKKIDIHAHMLEKFQDIMERYANLRNLPLKDLIFEFDGERINGSDTPVDLDMENESCVDVKVIGASLKPHPPYVPFVDLDKEEFHHKMLDVCVLD